MVKEQQNTKPSCEYHRIANSMGPPRSGAGVGVGMLTGAGDRLTWKYKRFLGFWFLVPWFRKIFYVFKNRCYILPHFHFMFFHRYWSHIHDFVDLFTRIFIICWRPSFRNLTKSWVSNIFRFIAQYF